MPWNVVVSPRGNCNSRSARWIASVAVPSATPCARLKLMVMAGNWPWWLIESGCTGSVVHLAKALSGTIWLVSRRADVDLLERGRVALKLRQHLLDHLISVHLGEILRHLPLAEGVVERIVDQLRLDAEARSHVAVDLERQRRAGVLLVGRDVAQFGQRFQFVEDLRRPRR